jgi:hypothetical protein
MKRWIMFCFTVLIILGISACRKDYPKDIPDWLKEKIKELKKETRRKKGCGGGGCMSIQEFSDGTETFYLWDPATYSGTGYIFYDYEGNFLCEKGDYRSGPCGDILELSSFDFIRRIWIESNF